MKFHAVYQKVSMFELTSLAGSPTFRLSTLQSLLFGETLVRVKWTTLWGRLESMLTSLVVQKYSLKLISLNQNQFQSLPAKLV